MSGTRTAPAGKCSLPRAVLLLVAALAVLALTIRLPLVSPTERTGALTFWVASTFRWSAALLAGYLATASLLALWSRTHRRASAAIACPRPTGALRRLLLPSGLALLLAGAPAGSAFGVSAEVPPTIVLVEEGPPTSGLDTPADPDPAAAPAPPSPASEAAPGAAPADSADHTVKPGEHFWSIAAALVTGELGRPPTEAEIRSLWLGLIEANRSRLVDPGNPDLLVPGQLLRVHPR